MDRLGGMVFAKANHVRFAVDDDRGGPPIHGDDPRPEVVHTLWEFFESRARDRLKGCFRCSAWFADESRNLTWMFCSSQCRDRAWNRARRRAMNHSQYRRKNVPEIVPASTQNQPKTTPRHPRQKKKTR